jgi:WASH complex subunit strumpellin
MDPNAPPRVNARSVAIVFSRVSKQLDGFRRSLEYIQDYLAMYGLKIWQEEFARIVRFNTELECNRFLKKKVLASESAYQSRSIPIPRFSPFPGSKDISFVGRTLRALLHLSDSRKTIFAPACSGWYADDGTEIAGLELFTKLSKAIGVHGLCGCDRLLGFRISNELQKLLAFYSGPIKAHHKSLSAMTTELRPFHSMPTDGIMLHSQALRKLTRTLTALLPRVARIGQAQLLRRAIANQLFFSARLNSNLLSCSLTAFNDAIMTDIQQHYRDPSKHPFPQVDNPILPDLNEYLQASGMTDPFTQIYITTLPKENLPLLLVLFVLHHLPDMVWNDAFGSLVAKRDKKGIRAPIDGTPIVVGIATLLKQFHPAYTHDFVGMLAQYIRSVVHLAFRSNANVLIPNAVTNALYFFKLFCNFAEIPFKALEGFLPTYLFCAITKRR